MMKFKFFTKIFLLFFVLNNLSFASPFDIEGVDEEEVQVTDDDQKDNQNNDLEIETEDALDKGKSFSSQFDIEKIYPPIIGGFEDDTVLPSTFRIKESAFSINSMSFIVDKNLKVINISLDIKLLETPNGKILKEIIELVEFRVSVVNYKNDFEILGFQACSKNKISA